MGAGGADLRFWERPRILRVRLGFNANSSSLAAFVTYFLWGSTAAVLIVNMVSAAIFAKDHGDARARKSDERAHD